MEKSENESDSSGDYVDATENLVSYSDEMYGITADIIQKHMQLLKDRLQDTKFGILDKLLASKGLTHQETTAIENCSTNPYDRSQKLIHLVLEKNIVSEFIKALVDIGQKHLVNYLRGDGVRNAEFGDDWPLGNDRIIQLNVNQEHLIDIIQPFDSGLIGLLLSARVLNQRQFNVISEKRNCIETNGALLNIIRQQSISDYNFTISCLSLSGQPHIAEILRKSGGIQRIHVSQEGDPQTVNEIEDAISDQFANLLRDHPIEEAQRILEMTQLKIFATKKSKSIYLYVYCATLEELTELHNLLVTGAVKAIVETLFNKLVSRQEPIVVSYTYSEEEYVKCKSYFEEIGSTFSESLSASEVEATPREEFQAPSFIREVPGSQSAASMDADIQKLRESRVTSDVFRVNLERHRVFVEGRMDPNHGLVDRLQESGVIDYNQVQVICAEKVSFKKSRKILDFILEGNSSEKITKFCEAMSETKQQHLLNYVEANGVYKTQFVGDWPLSEREINIIDENQSYLKQTMDTAGGLLAYMLKHNAITQCQAERVSEHTSRLDRNMALLEIIRRGSLSEYKNTIDILVETKQEHIAKILILASKVVQTHSSATGEEPIIIQTKTELATQLLKVIPKETRARLQQLLQKNNSGLIDDPLSELMDLVGPFLSDGTAGKQRTSENRREMESTHPESPEALPGMAERGEQEMPGIGTGTAQPAQGISPDPDERSDKENMENQRDMLIERMESEYGLLDKLRKSLTAMEIADIKCKQTIFEKNQRLLELIFKNNKHQDLIRALTETHQTHLVNWVRGNGEYRVEFDLDWPLKQKEIEILDDNQEAWTDLVDPCELLTLLYTKKVINKRQRHFIQEKRLTYEKNEELLNILRRCSLSAYFITIDCLRASNQVHIAAMLEGRGAVVQVHANLDADQLDERQTQIVRDLTSLLLETQGNRASLLLQELHTRLIPAKFGN